MPSYVTVARRGGSARLDHEERSPVDALLRGASVFALSDVEEELVVLTKGFAKERIAPLVRRYEAADEYPAELIDQMKELGMFGLGVDAPFNEYPVSTACMALVTMELSHAWMSMGGAIGGHTVVSKLVSQFGTEEQKAKYLPHMVTGALRATMALTEPSGGSDLAAMRTTARLAAGEYVVEGSKTWITNAAHSGLIALLCKTDPSAEPPHGGMSLLLIEKGPGVEVGPGLGKLGYRGVESCEVTFDNCRVPADAVLGGEPGQGFRQMMRGLEIGRIQVAARAVGVAKAAFEQSLAYAQERTAFGKAIWRHESVGNYLADMGVNLTAARLLMLNAAELFDQDRRADLEAGMAKLFASEAAMAAAMSALRIHAANGYSTDYEIERLFRDAPLLIVGEGTNEIQRNVIIQQLVARGGLA
jgi:alkylation response protein AidB-like acyl-CoA dehydrogenase